LPFHYTVYPDWPPLAWLAVCRKHEVLVRCGPRVEISNEWFCEAAWAGDYEEGAFDHTDIVAGTGGRWRDAGVYFISSGSTVDRLHSFQRSGEVFVSNSLPCLLVAVSATLSPGYPRYSQDLETIVEGLQDYQRVMQTSAGPVQLTYFNNLLWDGRVLKTLAKPGGQEDFEGFESYHTFLSSCMEAMVSNAASGARRYPYTPLGTLSTGYDSPTVADIARRFGCDEAISFDKARSGASDTGEAIARILGLKLFTVDTESWRSMPFAEVPFLAGCDIGESIYASAEPYLQQRLLLTGYHGDKIWDIATTDLGTDIKRGDRSGLALTEYRLRAGFLHCPVPFWGVRQIREINRISQLPEMQPWRLARSSYNRPICRRIVESAGVPRDLFGMEKKAAGPIISEEFLSPASLQDYLVWLGQHRSAWLRHFRLPPVRSMRFDRWLHTYTNVPRRIVGSLRRRLHNLPLAGGIVSRALRRLERRLRPPAPLEVRNLRRYVFPWAVERAKEAYSLTSGKEVDTDSL
jgi:hypothetical protein